MYAVLMTGGKQYRVSAGDTLRVEKLPVEVGSQITLDQVLMVGEGAEVKLGSPLLKDAQVLATVLGQLRGEKVRIFKLRRRKHYKKQAGHRQSYTELRIDAING